MPSQTLDALIAFELSLPPGHSTAAALATAILEKYTVVNKNDVLDRTTAKTLFDRLCEAGREATFKTQAARARWDSAIADTASYLEGLNTEWSMSQFRTDRKESQR